MVSVRKLGDDREHHDACQGGDERVAVEGQRERLEKHEHARTDHHAGDELKGAAPQPLRPGAANVDGGNDALLTRICVHLRTAPNVMPLSRCLRNSTVKIRMGRRKTVVPAATAGQSWPPSPMMIGMKGGAVCASPDVRSTAK